MRIHIVGALKPLQDEWRFGQAARKREAAKLAVVVWQYPMITRRKLELEPIWIDLQVHLLLVLLERTLAPCRRLREKREQHRDVHQPVKLHDAPVVRGERLLKAVTMVAYRTEEPDNEFIGKRGRLNERMYLFAPSRDP